MSPRGGVPNYLAGPENFPSDRGPALVTRPGRPLLPVYGPESASVLRHSPAFRIL